MLDRNWQRLILTHLEEKRHVGVLTGSELTDLRILLIAGKAHTKHTEGGDFRQATYRAVRQGMRSGKSILLEPWFSFRLEVPTENLGRAMSDITRMNGSFEAPETEGNNSVLTGSVPVASMGDYGKEVASYTKGHGRLSCTLKGYEPCHNPEEVMAEIGYDPEADVVNPTGSVFCAHAVSYTHLARDFAACCAVYILRKRFLFYVLGKSGGYSIRACWVRQSATAVPVPCSRYVCNWEN